MHPIESLPNNKASNAEQRADLYTQEALQTANLCVAAADASGAVGQGNHDNERAVASSRLITSAVWPHKQRLKYFHPVLFNSWTFNDG